MRKLLSILLILLLPVQGMLGNALAMQMDLSKPAAAIFAPMDCEKMGSPADTQDLAQAGGCTHCTDCPLCHLLAATVLWSVAAPAQTWVTPVFTPRSLATQALQPSFKPPIP